MDENDEDWEAFDATDNNDQNTNSNGKSKKASERDNSDNNEMPNIMDLFKMLNDKKQIATESNPDDSIDHSVCPTNGDPIIEENNHTICRMMNIQLKEFFNHIFIPYSYFKNDNWRISKILYNNEDVLFYNENYLAESDKPKFYEVFDRFIIMIEEILSTNTKLYSFLKKWTNTNKMRWCNNSDRSYLKSVLTDRDYGLISPTYVTNIYCDLSKKFQNFNKTKEELELHLNEIINQVNKEIKIFKKKIIMKFWIRMYMNNQLITLTNRCI